MEKLSTGYLKFFICASLGFPRAHTSTNSFFEFLRQPNSMGHLLFLCVRLLLGSGSGSRRAMIVFYNLKLSCCSCRVSCVLYFCNSFFYFRQNEKKIRKKMSHENKTWDKFKTTLLIFGQVGKFP